jgi:hypothetical protein
MTLDWSLWISVALAQVVLCVMATRAKLGCAWFPRYVYFATTKTFVLMAVAVFTRDLRLYTAVNSTAAAIGPVLALLVVGSLWRLTFGYQTKLPPGTLTRFRTLVCAIVCPLAVVLITFFRAHSRHAYFNSLINLEVVVLSACGVTLALMVFYSKHLGISWRSKPAGILAGFLWCFGANWLVMFLAGQEAMSIYAAQRIGQVAYLVALFVWLRVLLQKERAPRVIADEQVDRVLREFGLGDMYSARLRTRQSHS